MFLVVSYDVVDDQKRKKLADILKDYGRRVQYSVFELDLEKRFIEQMVKEATACIDLKEDSLRIYHLCDECTRKIDVIGIQDSSDRGKTTVI
jgi:CRISPR-associated protein Cas2